MKKEDIINTLKEHYSKEIRRNLIRSILEQEQSISELNKKEVYKTINQIFSFVLQQANWQMGETSQTWDAIPLEVMKETFPKLSNTKWYNEQILTTQQDIKIKKD